MIILQQVQQVQDAKSAGQLAQIEIQVANILREGNETLEKMHEVCKIKSNLFFGLCINSMIPYKVTWNMSW